MMKKLMSRSGVQRVVGDQCQYGLKSKDKLGKTCAYNFFVDFVL